MSIRPLRSVLAMIVVVALTGACDDDDDDFDEYEATLNGASEVPARVTNATGSFELTDRGSAMDFDLTVNNGVNVMSAHIHTGAVGVNGGILVALFSGDTIASQNGRLAAGTFTAANIQGLSGAAPISMDSLRALLRNGNAYVNVHTTTFPSGEIRGQIRADNDD
jgi:hypothetical protein